jgi:ABC-type Fe3+ transport system substrate-binding protein
MQMLDTDKKQFWVMVNVSMDLTNHPPLTKESIVAWWHKLKHLEFTVVQAAFDKWLDSSTKPPTPKDILDLCKPKEEFHVALAAPRNEEVAKDGLKKIEQVVAAGMKGKKDLKAWARKIIDNPSAYPDISLRFANEAVANSAV